ncbi:DedA family protein [Humitalea rosea]|uniref:DedA family protein n=1 Tax=Humitalea rosea TaxID=990373 RepID=UPI001FE8D4CC|nr:VTT domain-containing protein [Humitalea rosea]
MRLAEFWAEWGWLAYGVAALWAFFEGETFVLAAAAVGAVSGAVNPWILGGCVWFGSYAGDQTWFWLGRRYGPSVLRRFPNAEKKVVSATSLLDRYGTMFVLSFRFLYGIRNVASAACGLAGMDPARFAILNFIAAGIWAWTFVAAGWYLAVCLGPDSLGYVIAAVGLIILLGFLTRAWLARRRRRAVALAGEGPLR